MMNARLLLRWAAWSAATLLAGFTSSMGFGLEAWKALLVGGIAGTIPAVQAALLEYARTGHIPDPPTDPET